MPTLRGKWESATSGKQLDRVRKETRVVSVTILYLETDVEAQRQKGQASSPAPNAKAQTDGQRPSKRSGSRGESRSGASGTIPHRYRGKCTNPSCNYWHPPVCQNYLSESGCTYGNRCYFRHVEADGVPSKKVEERWCERISCLIKVVPTIGLCVSRFPSEKICSTERRKFWIKSRRQILQGYVAPNKNSGERVHREASFKSVNLMSVVIAHPGLRRGHKTKPRTKKDAPADLA